MTRFAYVALILCALTCHAFDASPLIQYCAASSASANWWDGLTLNSVWPMDDGAGAAIVDRAGPYNGTISGSQLWGTLGGVSCLAATGTTAVSFGDIYDKGTNSISFGAWQFVAVSPASLSFSFGKLSAASVDTQYGTFIYNTYFSVMCERSFALYNKYGYTTNDWTHWQCILTPTGPIVSDQRTNSFAIFLNGVLSASGNKLLTNNLQNTTTLKAFSDGTFGLKGSVRDAYVVLRSLSSNECATIWERTRATYGK